jgi:His-Xaa-Ser system protein HxsD
MVKETEFQGNLEINKKEGYAMVSVNPKIYPLDVVLSSAYIFTEKNYVLVDGDPEEELVVELRPKDKNDDLNILGKEFNNELINYASYAVQVIKNDQFRTAMIKRVLLTNSDKNECFNDNVDDEIEPWENDDQSNDIDDEIEPWEESDDDDDEDKPWFDDPEGIAVPWEEKYGDKNKEK